MSGSSPVVWRVALVAGATSGLGHATSVALGERGYSVAIAGRRVALATSQASLLERAMGVELDLTSPDLVDAAVSAVEEAYGPVEVLVLSGGGPAPSRAADLSLQRAREDAEVLLYGPISLIERCLPHMQRAKWGRIVAVGSSGVQQPIPGLATSNIFRAGLAAYLKTLAREVAADGVTVNMVLPGRIATDRVRRLDELRAADGNETVDVIRAASEAGIPIGRYGSPEEFAAAVRFLCSEEAAYITGAQIRVDGGLVTAL